MPCSPLIIICRYKGEMGRGEGAGSFSALFSFNNYMSPSRGGTDLRSCVKVEVDVLGSRP